MQARNLILPALLFLASTALHSQVIRLQNPSFEGEPRDATIPRAWHICKEGSTPDILPGPWGVYLEAYDGESYVGIITRSNGTWENMGQRLPVRLSKGNCYTFSLYLARSDSYVGYNTPILLRVWGGKEKCAKTQLLAKTDPIAHTDWEKYEFRFKVETDIQYLILEAFDPEGPGTTAGNILIDHLSTITLCTGA